MMKPLEVSSSLSFSFLLKKKTLGQFLVTHTHTKVQFDWGVWGWLADCGGDGGYWACSSRRVRCTECGCGYSFLRILNAEPVPVAPRLTIGSWLPLCAAPLLHGSFFFVIYFFSILFIFCIFCPFLLYTPVCAITSYFPFFFVYGLGLVWLQSRLACIVPDITSCDTRTQILLF